MYNSAIKKAKAISHNEAYLSKKPKPAMAVSVGSIPKPHTLKKGGKYNWRDQPERLVYLGNNWSGNGNWHQFALVSSPKDIWCECLDSDLRMIEETN